MKKILLLAITALVGVASAEPIKYTCPMHPEVVMTAPGNCPKCGMTLEPVKKKAERPTSNVQHPTSNSEEKKSRDRDIVEHEAKRLQTEQRPESNDMRHQMTMASSLNL